MKNIFLPKMPFGNSLCATNSDIKTYSSNLSTVVTSLEYYDTYGAEKKFCSKSFVFKTENLKIVSSASTAVTIKVNETNDVTLLIPFFGENTSIIDNIGFDWGVKSKKAIIMPKIGRGGFSTTRSTLSIDINEQKLNKTLSSMLAEETFVSLNRTKLIDLKYGNIDFMLGIKSLCSLIDANNCNNEFLNKLGLDEVFYRQIATMLLPEAFFSEKSLIKSTKYDHKNILENVIKYAKDNKNFFKKVSDLEKFTGLSTRTLQYTFSKHLNTTPKHWIREQQLKYTKELLENKECNLTISQIALELGYSNFSQFAKYYKEYHGVLPSHTKRTL